MRAIVRPSCIGVSEGIGGKIKGNPISEIPRVLSPGIYRAKRDLSASEVARSVTTTVVLSNMVVVVATGLAGGILVRIPPGRASSMTVVTLWLHGSVVVWLFVVSTLVAHISFRMSLVEVALVAVVGVDIESP